MLLRACPSVCLCVRSKNFNCGIEILSMDSLSKIGGHYLFSMSYVPLWSYAPLCPQL